MYINYLIKEIRFPFSIVGMPHKESNIHKNIFYSVIKGEFLRIACSTLSLRDNIPNAKEFSKLMKKQGSKHNATISSLGKIILAHPESFQD